MKLVQQGSGLMLAEQVVTADSFWKRLKGLMFTDQFPPGCCLYLRPCRSVHTYFMKYAIDVLHVDEHLVVTGMEHQLKPGKLGTSFRHTDAVIELPAGTLMESGIEIGQVVQIQPNKGRD